MKTYLDEVFVLLSGPWGWLGAAIVFIGAIAVVLTLRRSRWASRRCLIPLLTVGSIALSGLLAFPYALNVHRSRIALGPYPVGLAIVSLPVHGSREFANGILFDLWFPANVTYRRDAIISQCADLAALPLSVRNGKAAHVVLYMPHFKGSRRDNSRRLQYLASQGYIIVAFNDMALDAPGFPPSSVIERARTLEWRYATQADYDQTVALNDIRVDLEARKALQGVDSLSACANANGASPWRTHVDYQHLGFIGFSVGGAVAAEAAMLDQRVAAVVSLDGSLYGQAFQRAIPAPYLYILSDEPLPTAASLASPTNSNRFNERLVARYLPQQAKLVDRSGSAGIRITGTAHGSFSDALFEPHASKLWLLKDPVHTFDVTNAYILDFFNAHLRGDKTVLIDRRVPDISRVKRFSDVEIPPSGSIPTQ